MSYENDRPTFTTQLVLNGILLFIVVGLTLSLVQKNYVIKELRIVNSEFSNQEVIIDRLKTKIKTMEVTKPKYNENFIPAKQYYKMESDLMTTIEKYKAECQIRERLMASVVEMLTHE